MKLPSATNYDSAGRPASLRGTLDADEGVRILFLVCAARRSYWDDAG
jgi:hypothetical protein